MKCIALFGGQAVRDLVLQQLNDLGNLMLIESNAHTAYDEIRWGIEACNENGKVCHHSSILRLNTSIGTFLIQLQRAPDSFAFAMGIRLSSEEALRQHDLDRVPIRYSVTSSFLWLES